MGKMTAVMGATIRSAMMWQIALGFVLGTAGTLASRHASAEPQEAPAQHAAMWQLAR